MGAAFFLLAKDDSTVCTLMCAITELLASARNDACL